MPDITTINISKLEKLLQQYPLAESWKHLLATHIHAEGEAFHYILDSPEYEGYTLLEEDLLAGLSISSLGVLYEYSLAHQDKTSRKQQGQFFTPDDVAIVMAAHAKQFPAEGVWLDPCSGVGNLSWHLAAQQEDPEGFLLRRLLLSDLDELALFIARTIFTLSFQQGEPQLYHKLEDRFLLHDFLAAPATKDVAPTKEEDLYVQDSLFSSPMEEAPATTAKLSPALSPLPAYDYVIANPPYVSGVQREGFRTSDTRDLYSYFLENIISTARGFITITPQSFTHARKFSSLRTLLRERCSELSLYSFDNVPSSIFLGVKFGSTNTNTRNSIRASIMVGRVAPKSKSTPLLQRGNTTALLRWPWHERESLLEHLDDVLASGVPLSNEAFPKVPPGTVELYEQGLSYPKLSSILQSKAASHYLYLPASPRYFISALQSPVQRASLLTLRFSTPEEQQHAYLLLNSSLAYWWWRIMDGGMALTTDALHALPLWPIQAGEQEKRDLLAALETSEQENKVVKMNAGKPQENVKHPPELVARLTKLFVPEETAAQLAREHGNSSLKAYLPKLMMPHEER